MEFTVEFYETDAGKRPVQEFLLKLKATDTEDFAAVAAGLEKLRYRQYHREPLSKALGDGLSSCAMWANSIRACCGFSGKAAVSSLFTASAIKARPFRGAIWTRHGSGCVTGWKGTCDDQDEF
jgi:hypothetical protein